MPSPRLLAPAYSCLLALTFLLSFVSSSSAANGWTTRYGMNDQRGVWIGSPGLPGAPVQQQKTLAGADISAMRTSGFEEIRIPVALAPLDTTPADGVIDDPSTNVDVLIMDSAVREAAKRGAVIHPELIWSWDWTAPTTPGDRFMFMVRASSFAARYWAGGTFFAAGGRCGPDCGFTPIGTFEIWNEPNAQYVENGVKTYPFWKSATSPTPTPDAYGHIYASAWYGIKKVSPTLSVIPAGLAEETLAGRTPKQFLAASLSVAGADLASAVRSKTGVTVPALCFADAVNIHAYGWPSWTATQAAANVTSFAQSLATDTAIGGVGGLGGGTPPTWITEFGFRAPTAADEAAQNTSDTQFLAATRSIPRLGMVYPYTWRDAYPGNDLFNGGFGINRTIGTLGLYDTTVRDGGVRPGGNTLKNAALTAMKSGDTLRTPLSSRSSTRCEPLSRF